jgi:hypothetical protein
VWTTGLVTVLAAVAFLLSAASLGAQERQRDRECRCVDANGDEIENCSCLRSIEPDFSLFNTRFGARARIGVTVASGQSRRYDDAGAHVQAVMRNGPADEAGLRDGDIITAIGGRSLLAPLTDPEAEADLDEDQSLPVQRLLAILEDVEPGDEVEIEYVRDGDRREAALIAEENDVWAFNIDGSRLASSFTFSQNSRLNREIRDRVRHLTDSAWARTDSLVWHDPERSWNLRVMPGGGAWGDVRFRGDVETALVTRMDPCFQGDRGFIAISGRCVDGVEMEVLNPELGEYFGTESGLLVTEVHEDAALGLRPGDVLLAIDGREVEDFSHLRRVLLSYDTDEDLTLRILRRGEEMEVTGRRR